MSYRQVEVCLACVGKWRAGVLQHVGARGEQLNVTARAKTPTQYFRPLYNSNLLRHRIHNVKEQRGMLRRHVRYGLRVLVV